MEYQKNNFHPKTGRWNPWGDLSCFRGTSTYQIHHIQQIHQNQQTQNLHQFTQFNAKRHTSCWEQTQVPKVVWIPTSHSTGPCWQEKERLLPSPYVFKGGFKWIIIIAGGSKCLPNLPELCHRGWSWEWRCFANGSRQGWAGFKKKYSDFELPKASIKRGGDIQK